MTKIDLDKERNPKLMKGLAEASLPRYWKDTFHKLPTLIVAHDTLRWYHERKNKESKKMKEWLKERKLSITKFASNLDTTSATVYNWLSGKHKPTVATMKMLKNMYPDCPLLKEKENG